MPRLHRAPRTPNAAHPGLTLLELVVVMVILAALAGIIVPLLPNLARKGHTSAGATNLGEISKMIQLYASQHGDNYPDNYDSLVVGTNLATYIPTVMRSNTALTTGALTATDVSLLNGVGITRFVPMVEKPATVGSWNPTFYPYGSDATALPTSTTLATGATVALLNPAVAAAKFGLPSDGKYVVFGLGKYCTIVSELMNEAPVWYTPNEGMDPASAYARFALVFQVAGAGGASLARAKFVGPVELGPYGAMTKDDNLSYHYSLK